MIAKVDQFLIQEALKNEKSDVFGERNFLKNAFVIVSVCDPVHRALSNYLHVTRDVKYKTEFTIQEWNCKTDIRWTETHWSNIDAQTSVYSIIRAIIWIKCILV